MLGAETVGVVFVLQVANLCLFPSIPGGPVKPVWRAESPEGPYPVCNQTFLHENPL